MADNRRKRTAPTRIVKCIYLQKKHAQAFDKLAFEQKLQGGKTAPQLIEQAIELLLRKYKALF